MTTTVIILERVARPLELSTRMVDVHRAVRATDVGEDYSAGARAAAALRLSSLPWAQPGRSQQGSDAGSFRSRSRGAPTGTPVPRVRGRLPSLARRHRENAAPLGGDIPGAPGMSLTMVTSVATSLPLHGVPRPRPLLRLVESRRARTRCRSLVGPHQRYRPQMHHRFQSGLDVVHGRLCAERPSPLQEERPTAAERRRRL